MTIEANSQSSETMAKIVYVLYLASVVIGVSGIIAVVIAYIHKDEAPPWLQSHYHFQIRTFWIGALYLFFGIILSLAVVGWLLLLFWVVWIVVRCVKGMKCLDAKQAHPDVKGWLF
ncbi:hypothetical protein G8764_10780 [Pseudomaricurvus alcaniphilus]|uniref:DUF4870 family protein n=1 Tax=Pseudomaricurvus alcaniphilus TaxID=1166482 RepID=UPI0014087D6C|nr:hypothetical protein [Pseudomaricurvus alcaniphilus]NHN37781.1 hypothetical protein [Pseudomaricurvus alcaniphilus]